MTMTLRLGAVLAAVAMLAGCGLANQTASCDFRQGSVNGPEPRCQERVDTIDAATFKATCDGLKAKGSDGPCPREKVIGGCQIGTQGDGSKVNDWYYAPETCPNCKEGSVRTVDQVKHECGSSPFLNP